MSKACLFFNCLETIQVPALSMTQRKDCWVPILSRTQYFNPCNSSKSDEAKSKANCNTMLAWTCYYISCPLFINLSSWSKLKFSFGKQSAWIPNSLLLKSTSRDSQKRTIILKGKWMVGQIVRQPFLISLLQKRQPKSVKASINICLRINA